MSINEASKGHAKMRFVLALVGFGLGYYIGETLFLNIGGEEIFIDWPAGLIGCLAGYYIGKLWEKKKTSL